MAEVNYNGGVPDVAPQVQAPDDEQRIQPTAAAGLDQLGQGAEKAANFYDNAASDDAFNNYQSSAVKLLYGDPTKTGPDGQPDTGFMGLSGAAAMAARPQVESQLDQLQQSTRDNLSNPAQQLQFDQYSRRYRAAAAMDIGSHTDQQAKAWYGQVSDDTINNGRTQISVNPTDNTNYLNAANDIINGYTKKAEQAGAVPGDEVWNSAYQQGRQVAFKTRLTAIGATDPLTASKMLQAHPELAGTDYAGLEQDFRTRSTQQAGQDWHSNYIQTNTPATTAAYATSPANPANPVYQQVTSSLPGGYSPAGAARLVQIESGGRDVTNKFGYAGVAQFGKAEWAQYGAGGDIHNFGDSVAAAQRYAIANAKVLTPVLGRQPTDAELYLAHQQGAGGATKLLSIPNAPAAQAIGYSAVLNNLPTSMRSQAGSITSQQFVAYWTHKFNGTTPANVVAPDQAPAQSGPRSDFNPPAWDQSATGSLPTAASVPLAPSSPQGTAPDAAASIAPQVGTSAVPPPSVAGIASTATTPAVTVAAGVPVSPRPSLADEFQAIEADPNLNPQEKDAARKAAVDDSKAQAIADDATAAQVKQQNDASLNRYFSGIMQGQMPTLAQVANDNTLNADGKKAVSDFMVSHADMSVSGASQAYGPGYWKAYQQILADPGDPSRISDPADVLKMAGPGGSVTGLGAQKLLGVMNDIKKPDQAAIEDTKKSLIAYAKSKLSFQQDPSMMAAGVPPLKDPQGEQLFNAQFIPRFEAAYQQATDKGLPMFGKNGFLNQDNVDAIADSIRNPREMALSKLEAQNGVNAAAPILAPPTGTDPTAWQDVLAIPALSKGGNPWPAQNWAMAVHRLWENPTPENQQAFDAHFSNPQFTASQLLDVLKPNGVTDDQERATRQMDAGEAKQQDLGPNAADEIGAVQPPAYNPITDPRMGLGAVQ